MRFTNTHTYSLILNMWYSYVQRQMVATADLSSKQLLLFAEQYWSRKPIGPPLPSALREQAAVTAYMKSK